MKDAPANLSSDTTKPDGFRAAVRRAGKSTWTNTNAIRRRVLKQKRFWRVNRSLKLPNLHLYQQMIICFLGAVLIPLLGVSFIIYSINQTALKKELRRYTEHTADALYRDLSTEMSWQQQQAKLLATTLSERLSQGAKPRQAVNATLKLGGQNTVQPTDLVGLYALAEVKKGLHQQAIAVRTSDAVQKEWETGHLLRSDTLPQIERALTEDRTYYDVLYLTPMDLKKPPYYALRVIIPLHPARPSSGKQPPRLAVLLQKRFDYLSTMIAETQHTLHNGVSVIDNTGAIIAGPDNSVSQQKHIPNKELERFLQLEPGVTHRYFTLPQPGQQGRQASSAPVKPTTKKPEKPFRLLSSHPLDNEDPAPLEKVIIKIPEIGWGIIIESPYNVQQAFVKRARNQSLMLIAGCLLLVMLLAAFYVYGINRNFRQLIKGTKALAQGNYSRRVRLITNSFTPFEIIYLAGEFNRMGRKMADSWLNSQALNHELQAANEKLAKLDELKSNLIDTVSHELRTPLTNIKGYTSRLLRYEGQANSPLDSVTRVKSLKVIKQQADRLGRLVDDLLVIPELEQERLRVFMDTIAFWPILERCIQTLENRNIASEGGAEEAPKARAIELDTAGLDLDLLTVHADPDRLEQVLVNLLDNAMKYAQGEGAIVVTLCQTDSQRLQVEVANPCPPIKPEELGTLFEKFKRLDDSLVRTTRGSGLGLYITRGLVEAMGGQIFLAYTQGCYQVRFTLELSIA